MLMWTISLTEIIELQRLLDVLTYNPRQPMIFSSGLFLWLFLAVTGMYFLLRNKTTARLAFVTLFSYYFYYKSSGTYFFLLGIVTVTDFFLAQQMARSEERRRRIALLLVSLCVNLGLLIYFKYTNFFYEMLAPLWGGKFEPLDIFLPVGISFFTFQSLSYTIDVYRRELTPLNNLLDYAFYVSFFPQLVAGPIVRARDFIPQIRQPLFVSSAMFSEGAYYIIAGLFKKAVISDYISVNFVERVFENPTLYSGVENLMAVYGYALQIYCDFSGYSDMAIGIALLLGFRFPFNFNSPYQAENITEFWHRWHISLSTWLKDYLYISLGGNRRGRIRTYVNLFLTMLLGGLWHGASWNFVIWGGLHGVALAVHKWVRSLRRLPKDYRSTGFARIAGIVLTFHFVCLCWIFFRHTSFDNALLMIRQIFTSFHPELFVQLIESYRFVFILMAIGYLFHATPRHWEKAGIRCMERISLAGQVLIFVALIYFVLQIKSADVQPFIYFQF